MANQAPAQPAQAPGQTYSVMDFANLIKSKYPTGVASDGRAYSAIPNNELVTKFLSKYGDSKTSDGRSYKDIVDFNKTAGSSMKTPPTGFLSNLGGEVKDIGKGAVKGRNQHREQPCY